MAQIMEIIESNDNKVLIEFYKEKKILLSVGPECNKCNKTMMWKERKGHCDDYTWRCSHCSTFKTIRHNSFLSQFRLPLNKITKLLFHWSMQLPITDTMEVLDVSKSTITTFYQQLRLICVKDLDRDHIILGGNGSIVEIDESLFIKVKHNRGKDLVKPQIWVFGLHERTTKKCLFLVVPSRDAHTLLNIIYKHVAPRTIIYSDCWKSYTRINQLDKDYIHRTVNHDLFFVDPSTGVHTNTIESYWCSAKQQIKKMRGVNRKYLQNYLDEYMWRKNGETTRLGTFELICNALRKFYDPFSSNNDLNNINDFEKLSINSSNDDMDPFDVADIDDDDVPDLPDYPLIEKKSESALTTVEQNKAKIENQAESILTSLEPSTPIITDYKLFEQDSVKLIEDFIQSEKLVLNFSQLDVKQRSIIHSIAHKNGLNHVSKGKDEQRILIVSKNGGIVGTPNKRKVTSSLLINNTCTPLPENPHIDSVLNKQLTPKPSKKGRKPKSSINENFSQESSQPQETKIYNLRNRNKK